MTNYVGKKVLVRGVQSGEYRIKDRILRKTER